MMDFIFSPDGANALNQAVQKKLAPQLFLCCNYNPNPCTGMSEDGKYYPAILNLYMFAYDSSCIIKNLPKINPPIVVSEGTKKSLTKSLEVISNLRSIAAHNNSEMNGFEETNSVQQYQKWVQVQIGKPEPDCPADYVKLLDALKTVGAALFNAIEDYINNASKHPKKNEIVEDWEERTIHWYCNRDSVKREIFLGVLENEYLARAQSRRTDRLYRTVAYWVQEYYTRELALERIRQIAAKTKSAEARRLIQKREQEIEQICIETEQLSPREYPYLFLDRLYSELPEMLRKTLKKEGCSMLPDDLLQRQIQALFSDVTLPPYQ